MKRMMLTAAIFLAATATVLAQPQKNDDRRDPKKMTARAAEHLKFDDAQNAKLIELNKKYDGDDYDRRKYHDEFRAIMTDEQKKQAEEMRKKRGERDGGRRKPK